MMFPRLTGIVAFLIVFLARTPAQVFQSSQQKLYQVIPDTLVLDSLSLVPGSIRFRTFPGDTVTHPRIDYKTHALIFHGRKPDSIAVSYRRFPYNFEKTFFHKDQNQLYRDLSRPGNPFTIRYDEKSRNGFIYQDGLSKNGSISRGISFGNAQDVVVNSNLNLQVSGKLTPDIDLLMAATDNNIPFQADGTTAQLQEFDKVFIQLSNESSKIVVGDYQLARPANSYFMNFYKRAQGFYLENTWKDTAAKLPLTFHTQVSGAVSRGKFSRQVFFGTESNQGPYRLRGADNEAFIVILSGTERIYIDGRLLQRGQENDYIIDYNTAEITFTARQLITKDKRIVAEFQYAERNYARSLFFFGEEVCGKKASVYLNFFSEQDNKNRPLQQTLSQEQKNVLIDVGDSLQYAIFPGVEEATFNNNDVFYMETDTVADGALFSKIYVQSSDPEVAKYRLRFSSAGANRGNYVQVSAAANGRVFKWVAPVNGVPQGNFEPVIPLVAPRQQQMLTSGVTYSVTKRNIVGVEGAYTRLDINRFSTKDQGNDEAGGVKVYSRNETVIHRDSAQRETQLVYNLNYELIEKDFSQVERFRQIEFERDWNRPLSGIIYDNQQIGGAEFGIQKAGVAGLMYSYNHFDEGLAYEGKKHGVTASYSDLKNRVSYNGSFLNSSDSVSRQRTEFYRHRSLVSRKIDRVRLTYTDEFENNLFMNPETRSLLPRAYQFWEWEGAVSNADSGRNNVKVFYRERRDKLRYTDVLRDSTLATNVGVQASIGAIRNNPFNILVTYRKLELRNVVGSFLKPDNTLLNRVEYNPRWWKGFITASVFYETGYGLENKREFYYLEVAPGQGQYAWNDYNGNGIKELNEFEVAQFSDQARYIRIYTPTNAYVKVLQNQFSFSASMRPNAIVKGDGALRKFVNRWWLQTAIRRDNKMADGAGTESYNPFFAPHDTLLMAANDNVRHSVFFNQTSAVFGADYTRTDNRARTLLTNGLEERTLRSHEIRWRLNFLQSWSVQQEAAVSEKGNRSAFFSVRNYLIEGIETEQRIAFQPNTLFRISAIYKYGEKLNAIEGGFQRAYTNNYGMELRYNQTEKGSLSMRTDYVKILFNDAENSAVAYEMLAGLSRGDNYTWEVVYQRNLSNNIQVSINYNGRKTPTSPPVHIGGAQIRAFF